MTAPAVSPLITWRAARKVKISGGMAISVANAISLPHSTPRSVTDNYGDKVLALASD